ncbi:MAG TPA: CotH kinase family protein [Chthoniobacteraceae bacterium]|nr:CotH kinase family protein [Chthoniobacteraceae bacterium]
MKLKRAWSVPGAMKKSTAPSPQRRSLLHLFLLTLLISAATLRLLPGSSQTVNAAEPRELSKEEARRKAADDFFKGPIVKLAIEMTKEEIERLKRDQRNYAEASIKENDAKLYKGVAIKLKGAAGSFQGIEGKPGLTISLDKFKGAERFHGMKKFHLNNCAQDGSYLSELIAGEMARAAGVPASRCTHAFVTLNGRDLGLYVFKEAFTRDFLAAFFSDTSGDLWDGGFCKEIEENMEKDLGDTEDKRPIKELIAACQEGDNQKRWERLGKILDIDRFISFCAMEAILCHWDGYNFNRNNYRVYQDATTGKISFFLHGMDQMFGDTNFPIIRDFGAMVGSAVMRCPEGKRMYQARLEHINNTVLKGSDWPARVVEAGNKVRDALEAKNKRQAKDFQGQLNGMRDRVQARIAVVGKQLGEMPQPIAFDSRGAMKLGKGWHEQPGGGRLDQANIEGKNCFHIKAEGPTASSWRKTLRLPAGKYRFEGTVKTAGVLGMDEAKGKGAGLRISGSVANRAGVEGDANWHPVAFEFETGETDVTLVADVRATKGEAWFAADSLQLVKVK